MAVRDLKPWIYTCEDGRQFVRRADAFLTGQLNSADPAVPKVGGATAATLSPYEPMPSNYRPRRVTVTGTGGYKATVVAYSNDCDLWTNDATTINVRDASGTSHACQVTARTGERLGRKIGRGQ